MPDISNDELAVMMQEQFSKIQEDISGIKADVSSLKTDVSSLKTDVSSLKTSVSSLEHEMSFVKFEIRETNKKVDDLREDHGAKLDNLLNLVEGLAKKSTDHDDEIVFNQAAHDRYNKNFYEIKTQLDVKNIEVIKPFDK